VGNQGDGMSSWTPRSGIVIVLLSMVFAVCFWAVLWVWLGTAYQLAIFARISPVAHGFGALSIVLDVKPDLGLLVAGVVAVGLFIWPARAHNAPSVSP
jgi:hypothetical protein